MDPKNIPNAQGIRKITELTSIEADVRINDIRGNEEKQISTGKVMIFHSRQEPSIGSAAGLDCGVFFSRVDGGNLRGSTGPAPSPVGAGPVAHPGRDH